MAGGERTARDRHICQHLASLPGNAVYAISKRFIIESLGLETLREAAEDMCIAQAYTYIRRALHSTSDVVSFNVIREWSEWLQHHQYKMPKRLMAIENYSGNIYPNYDSDCQDKDFTMMHLSTETIEQGLPQRRLRCAIQAVHFIMLMSRCWMMKCDQIPCTEIQGLEPLSQLLYATIMLSFQHLSPTDIDQISQALGETANRSTGLGDSGNEAMNVMEVFRCALDGVRSFCWSTLNSLYCKSCNANIPYPAAHRRQLRFRNHNYVLLLPKDSETLQHAIDRNTGPRAWIPAKTYTCPNDGCGEKIEEERVLLADRFPLKYTLAFGGSDDSSGEDSWRKLPEGFDEGFDISMKTMEGEIVSARYEFIGAIGHSSFHYSGYWRTRDSWVCYTGFSSTITSVSIDTVIKGINDKASGSTAGVLIFDKIN